MKELAKMNTTVAGKDAKSYLRLPYARILIPAEEGGFFAEILEFPGCFAEGETPNKAFRNLEGVAESWIEATLAQGDEIPPPSASESHSGRIALRLPRDLHRLAARKAKRDGVSLNYCLVTAVAAWVGADNLFERIARRIEVDLLRLQKTKEQGSPASHTAKTVRPAFGGRASDLPTRSADATGAGASARNG